MASAVKDKPVKADSCIAAKPDSASETQNQTNNIAVRNLSQSANESSSLKSPLSVTQLPGDPIALILHQLPLKDILNMRVACSMLQGFIDSNHDLQPLISYQKLKAMPGQYTIPIDDLKFDYTDEKLSVEVSNNLCLWKLTHTPLKQTLPWISHLIIKKGKPNELLELFNQLKENKRLTKIYLLNCEVDAEALNSLKQLQIAFSSRIPDFYCCDLKTFNCEPPSYGPHLFMLEPNEAPEYSIERFVTKESDRIALKKFSDQVEKESPSGEQIVQNLESLKSVIKTGIISSIWFSTVMPINDTTSSFSKNNTDLAVTTFISMHPHHPAILAALNHALNQ
jgi:hypothetical protein